MDTQTLAPKFETVYKGNPESGDYDYEYRRAGFIAHPKEPGLSAQQQAVLDWAKHGEGSLNLIARAGCGKTTTLLALVKYLVFELGLGNIFLGAYNKIIADEIKAKLARQGVDWKSATAGTMHSAGFSAWRKVAPRVKVDADKLKKLWNENLDSYATKPWFAFVTKAVSLAKQRAFGHLVKVNDQSAWLDLCDHFALDELVPDTGEIQDGIGLSQALLKLSLAADYQVIDFDDMILAPLAHDAKLWQYDWVLIDESQDTNPARRALALAMLKPCSGRLVAVGDPAQAIYGFTGADSDAMDLIKNELDSNELPLNTTYRCPKSVVRLAQTWVPDITAHESAPEGIVRHIELGAPTTKDAPATGFWAENLKPTDVVLCRNTKPLVELAYSLIRAGIACHVEGREIGRGLTKLCRKWKLSRIDALCNKLAEYREREVQKWLAKDKPARAEAVADQVETILVLAERLTLEEKATEIDQLVAYIDRLFADTAPGARQQHLTLSTVHKSKGREWQRVYLLGRNAYMPSRWACSPWQQEQERNLIYVAVTRAQAELVEITVPIEAPATRRLAA